MELEASTSTRNRRVSVGVRGRIYRTGHVARGRQDRPAPVKGWFAASMDQRSLLPIRVYAWDVSHPRTRRARALGSRTCWGSRRVADRTRSGGRRAGCRRHRCSPSRPP